MDKTFNKYKLYRWVSRNSKFLIFAAPATIFYLMFFIIPFFQGIQYSFTDWNGITPDLKLRMELEEYEDLISKTDKQEEVDYLNRFYKINEDGDTYIFQNWRVENGKEIETTQGEKNELKRIIKQVGSPIKFIGLDNYKEILTNDTRFPKVIGFTVLFTILTVVGSNLIALLIAIALDSRLRSKNGLRAVFFLPNVLSMIIVAFVWQFMFTKIIPSIPNEPWLGSVLVTPYSVIFVAIWQGLGFFMIIYLAGLQTIPGDVLESATIDGANGLQKFFHIKLPFLLPSLTICMFLSISNSLKSFDIVFNLTHGGPGYVTTPIVLDIYNNAFTHNQYGYATAKAIILCATIILITGIQLFLMKRKEVRL